MSTAKRVNTRLSLAQASASRVFLVPVPELAATIQLSVDVTLEEPDQMAVSVQSVNLALTRMRLDLAFVPRAPKDQARLLGAQTVENVLS